MRSSREKALGGLTEVEYERPRGPLRYTPALFTGSNALAYPPGVHLPPLSWGGFPEPEPCSKFTSPMPERRVVAGSRLLPEVYPVDSSPSGAGLESMPSRSTYGISGSVIAPVSIPFTRASSQAGNFGGEVQ